MVTWYKLAFDVNVMLNLYFVPKNTCMGHGRLQVLVPMPGGGGIAIYGLYRYVLL